MHVLEATKIARNIIRACNKRRVELWTNKYKHCRTVKCYLTDDTAENEIVAMVAKHLPNATVKVVASPFNSGSSYNSYFPPSLIIRIPN